MFVFYYDMYSFKWAIPPCVISCRSVLLFGETGVLGEDYRPVSIHWNKCIMESCIEYILPWAVFKLIGLVVIGNHIINFHISSAIETMLSIRNHNRWLQGEIMRETDLDLNLHLHRNFQRPLHLFGFSTFPINKSLDKLYTFRKLICSPFYWYNFHFACICGIFSLLR
jgi:hypothetical protein